MGNKRLYFLLALVRGSEKEAEQNLLNKLPPELIEWILSFLDEPPSKMLLEQCANHGEAYAKETFSAAKHLLWNNILICSLLWVFLSFVFFLLPFLFPLKLVPPPIAPQLRFFSCPYYLL